MIGTSVHEGRGEAQAETVPCFRCRGWECPKCGGTGRREPARCAGCGEPSGSVSLGTGYPIMGKKGGPMYHVGCEPGDLGDGLGAMLGRVGA